MKPNRTTLKQLFSDDPETLRVLEARDQTDLLQELVNNKDQESNQGITVKATKIEFLRGEQGEKGDTGEKGEKGNDGYTPQKSVDYIDGKDGVDGSDGKNGIDGINGNDGRDGLDGKEIEIKDILQELKKEKLPIEFIEGAFTEKDLVQYLKKNNITREGISDLGRRISDLRAYVELNYGGHGGTGTVVRLYDLSSQLNGVTKSFTILNNTAITLVNGSSAPFIFAPTVDYTGSGTTTITFTSNVDASSALASGQTLIVQYY